MGCFLSIDSLSNELECVTFLSFIVGVNHFPILGKKIRQSHLIIIIACPQSHITHILRYLINFPLILII